MVPLQHFASNVLADVLRRQPSSAGRTSFAWHIAVGAGLARSTTVELADGVLHVRARDPRWAQEIERARDTILLRMQQLLGRTDVTRLVISE